jgi:hypothetical protein
MRIAVSSPIRTAITWGQLDRSYLPVRFHFRDSSAAQRGVILPAQRSAGTFSWRSGICLAMERCMA